MSVRKIDKIAVIHYAPLKERKQYLENTLSKQTIPYEFRTNFNRNSPEIDDAMHFTFNADQIAPRNEIFKKQDVGLIDMSNANRRPGPRACFLEHVYLLKEFIESEDEHMLVLEDDVRIDDNFFAMLPRYLNELPQDYDVCYAGLGCNLTAPADTGNGLLVEHKLKKSRCTDCFIVSKKGAKIIVDNIFPAFTTIDWEIMYLQGKYGMKVFWVKNPLVVQGSETGAYESSLPMFN